MVERKNKTQFVSAVLHNLPITPRKVRLIVDLVRYKSIREALAILSNLTQRSAPAISKLIRSAVANAAVNNKVSFEKLSIALFIVGESYKLKRSRPRAKGVTFPIWKRASHVYLKLQINDDLSTTTSDSVSQKKNNQILKKNQTKSISIPKQKQLELKA